MNFQNWIHWLEQGRGARWLAGAAGVLALLLLSGTVAFKQFHGPRSEETLRQADLGRSIAAGRGFRTSINYPQVHAVLEREGQLFDESMPFPDLYHPPLYALTIAGALALLPDATVDRLFSQAPAPPDGFGADYVLLGLNMVLLWIAAGLTWWLGRRLFDPVVGVVGAVALLVSTSVWSHVLAVDGTPLAMVLLLVLFLCLTAADEAVENKRRDWIWWGGAGIVVGLLFLTDYPLGILGLVVAGHAVWCRRAAGAAWMLVAALLVAGPWMLRNMELVGSPVALAGQDLALRSGDPTAEPVEWRTTLSAEAPALSIDKLGNKTLTAVREALRDGLWSDGGLFMTAFFVAGWLYRFRRDTTNRLRTTFAVALGVMIVAQGLMNSGEGERIATAVAAPLIIIFGAGFFTVLVGSSAAIKHHPRWAVVGLLFLQLVPLGHDLFEPRRVHFSYPPYYPSFFLGMSGEMSRRGGEHPGWMADVPAGAAWYSGQRVWAQPNTLRDFYAVHVEQGLVSLVLTPHTLDRPYFAELAGGAVSTTRFGEWGRIYTGLLSGRMPREFPLGHAQKLSDNFYVLINPRRIPLRGN